MPSIRNARRARLQVAAFWGETAVGTRTLTHRDSLELTATDPQGTPFPCPEGLTELPPKVVRPEEDGWLLDASGSLQGTVEHEGVCRPFGEIGVKARLRPGDAAVLHYPYGFSLFLQAIEVPPAPGWRRPGLTLPVSLLFALVLSVGSLLLVRELSADNAQGAGLLPTKKAASRMVGIQPSGNGSKHDGNRREPDAEETQKRLLEIATALRGTEPQVVAPPSELLAQEQADTDGIIAVWDRSRSVARLVAGRHGLDDAQINRSLSAHMDVLQACLTEHAAAGHTRIRVTVDAGGTVTGSRLVSSSINDPATERCLLKETRRIPFGPGPRPTTLEVSLSLRK